MGAEMDSEGCKTPPKSCRLNVSRNPIGSILSIFTYIYHTNRPHVDIKPYMDLMGIGEIHVYHFGLHERSWCFITFRLDLFCYGKE